MWPTWAFISMAMLAAFLFGVLCYPMVKEVNSHLACWWIRRRAHREHLRWLRQQAERQLTEALR